MTPAELALASEFPAATRERWQELAGDVPGSATYDGITRAALYTAADAAPAARLVRAARGWDVRQRHTTPDRGAIADDLERGVTSLWLAGLPLDALPELLAELSVPVVLDAGADYRAAADILLGIPDARGNAGADPIGWRARTGTEPELDAAAELAVRVARDFPGLRAIVVDALPYHEAGGSDAQELGCALATVVAYLRALTAAGLDVDAAVAQLELRLAAGVDQFLTIAKFRAARRMWARVVEVSGGAGTAAQLHAVTSPAMLTRRDPFVNMLRGTVACFAAGVGGADAITVLPFDSAIGLPDKLGRRIARNTQTILLEESTVANVIDPAGESWYVERLTDELAHAAWSWFTEIERTGGIRAALDSGLVGDRLAETWRSRKENLAAGTDRITGVTEFPDPDEKPLNRPPAPPPPSGGLPRVRYAEEFE
jgi:methylmalonyl-CoA mutase